MISILWISFGASPWVSELLTSGLSHDLATYRLEVERKEVQQNLSNSFNTINLNLKMMSKSLSSYIICAFLVVYAISSNYLLCKAQDNGFSIPNPLSDKPLFQTMNKNGRLIAIHIP